MVYKAKSGAKDVYHEAKGTIDTNKSGCRSGAVVDARENVDGVK
jgi:hypothetical protein